MTEQEFIELAAAYALGALDENERIAFERALAEHPEWEPIVDENLAVTALLAETVTPEAPQPAVKLALLDRLDAVIDAGEVPSAMRDAPAREAVISPDPLPQRDSAVDDAGVPEVALPSNREIAELDEADVYEVYRPRKRRFGVRLVASLAVAALIAGTGAGLFGVLQPSPSESVSALEEIVQAPDAQFASTSVATGGQAGLTWSAAEGRAVLMTRGLESAPTGHTYELWYVRGEEKIPAGTFDPDAAGDAAVIVSGEMHEGDTIAVTVEVTGGSVDGKPSDVLVLSIPTGPAAEKA